MAGTHIEEAKLNEILDGIKKLRVCLLGDLCTDIYWHADMKISQLSRETPHFPLPVTEERVSLGGGGNVAANVCALSTKTVAAVSVIGEDWRGTLLSSLLDSLHVDTEGLVKEQGRTTFAYCKPMRHGISDVVYEDPRLDFINTRPISPSSEDRVIAALRKAAAKSDVLLVSDQFLFGSVSEKVREAVCELGKAGLRVFVDSRHNIGYFHDVILKPNELEATNALGVKIGDDWNYEKYFGVAETLAKKCSGKAIVTLGKDGSVFSDGTNHEHNIPWPVTGEVDIVGAGDTFLSAFSCAAASGATWGEAADLASLCSSITVKKLGITGTASQEEIKAAYKLYK
jgi:rfaE bifunctional protein kinase chain/domain